jgi:hypothetical protein
MHKMAGCSRDHSKEIDLFNKTYDEKLERVAKMIYEAE